MEIILWNRSVLMSLENTATFWPDGLGVVHRKFLESYMKNFLPFRKHMPIPTSCLWFYVSSFYHPHSVNIFFRTSTIPILLSTYAKILMHSQPPDTELQKQIWAIFSKWDYLIIVINYVLKINLKVIVLSFFVKLRLNYLT